MTHEFVYIGINRFSGEHEATCSCDQGDPDTQFAGASEDDVKGYWADHVVRVTA